MQDGKASRFFKADQIQDDPGALVEEEVEQIEGEGYAFAGQRLLTDEQAIQVVGMGTWRLREFVTPPLHELVAWLEGTWRHTIEQDLGLGDADPVRFPSS